MSRHNRRQALESGLREFQQRAQRGAFGGAGGAMEAFILRLPDLRNERGMFLMMQFARLIMENEDKPPLCLTCDYEFTITKTPPGALAVTVPLCENADRSAIVTGVCDDCCARLKDEDLLEEVFNYLQKMGIAKSKLAPPSRADN